MNDPVVTENAGSPPPFDVDVISMDSAPKSVKTPASEPTKSDSQESTQEVAGVKAEGSNEVTKETVVPVVEPKPVESYIEKRFKDTQAKLHEESSKRAAIEKQLNELKTGMTAKQSEVFDAILANVKQKNPGNQAVTEQQIEELFNKTVEHSPYQAVQLLINEATKSIIEQKSKELNGKIDEVKGGLNGIQLEASNKVITNNLNTMASDPEFKANQEQFLGFMFNKFDTFGNKEVSDGMVRDICSDPAKLKSAWDSFNFATRGDEALNKALQAKEAVIAAKLSQAQGSGKAGNVQQKFNVNDIYKKEATPGFEGYFN